MIEPEVPTRSGTTAEWAAATAPILGDGEIGIDNTLDIIRIGDGVTAFPSLPIYGGGRVVTGVATLVGGTVTVAVPGVTANSTVHATTKTLGTVTVASAFRAVPSANQIVLTASQPTDTSVVAWSVIV